MTTPLTEAGSGVDRTAANRSAVRERRLNQNTASAAEPRRGSEPCLMTIAWPSLNSSAPKESPVARLPLFCRHKRCLVPLTGLRWKNMRRLVIDCSEHEPRLIGENWYIPMVG